MSVNNYFSLQVSQPCHEDWAKMTPSQKGRFCDSCQKVVVDFTSMTDRQIIDFFENYAAKPNTSLCGRLDDRIAGQLFKRPNTAPTTFQPAFWRKWAAILAISTGILGATPLQATNFAFPQRQSQTSTPIPPTKTPTNPENQPDDKTPMPIAAYTGVVLDNISSSTPKPIAGAKITLLLGNLVSASATTNEAGEFTLDLPYAFFLMPIDKIQLHIQANTYTSQFRASSREELLSNKPVQIFLAPMQPQIPHNGGLSIHHYQEQKNNPPKRKRKQRL